MSVFTPVSEAELQAFLAEYTLGDVTEFVGISSGIENTNFFVSTTQGRYVLTLFEQHEADAMPYFIDLMAWLNEHQVPCAHPIPDRDGAMLKTLNGRPAALVQRLSGASAVVAAAVGEGRTTVRAAFHDLASGRVELL